MIDPKAAVCPECDSAVGAMCRIFNNKGDITYVNWIHITRIEAVIQQATALPAEKPAPEPSPAETEEHVAHEAQ